CPCVRPCPSLLMASATFARSMPLSSAIMQALPIARPTASRPFPPPHESPAARRSPRRGLRGAFVLLQPVHDVRVVRAPEALRQQSLVDSRADLMGRRALRIPAACAREPDRLRDAFA